jgi:hypothetical protein
MAYEDADWIYLGDDQYRQRKLFSLDWWVELLDLTN